VHACSSVVGANTYDLPMRPVILILGPTAGGKSRLAIDLANTLAPSHPAAEIISCDSMQIYRGMDIGTAKPTRQEQASVPHHLIDIVDPCDDSFSVDRWMELAQQKIDEIWSRHRHPIIVGGTNLYVQAFLSGMTSEGPAPDASLRARLNEVRPEELRAWLERVDPTAAERIHPNDRKRTIRAIEVFESTRKPLSAMQTQWQVGSRPSALGSQSDEAAVDSRQPKADSDIIIGLDYPVEMINRRINARVKAMIEEGFVDEVRRLHQSKSLGRNAREALGYKQIIEHLDGRCTLEEAIEQMKIRTRRYAKQQRTWLRRFKHYPNSIWIAAGNLTPDEIAVLARRAMEQHPLLGGAKVPHRSETADEPAR
jgi:tRNA dimethylallyltransferase